MRIEQIHNIRQGHRDMRDRMVQSAEAEAIVILGRLTDHFNTDPAQIAFHHLVNPRIYTFFDRASYSLNNRCTGGQRLQAAVISATTQWPVFVDGDVTKFTGAAAWTAVQLPIEKDCRTNSHSCVYVNEVIQAYSETEMLLRGCAPACAILQQGWHSELALYDFSERDILPFLHLAWPGKRQHHACVYIDHPGVTNSNTAQSPLRSSGIGDRLMNELEGSRQYRFASFREPGFGFVLIESPSLEVGNDDPGVERSEVHAYEKLGVVPNAEGNRLSAHGTGIAARFHNQSFVDQVVDDGSDTGRTETRVFRQFDS